MKSQAAVNLAVSHSHSLTSIGAGLVGLVANWRLLGAAALLAAAGAAQADGPPPVFKADLVRGEQVSVTCQACHLADGNRGAPANPILAGQHPEYTAKQLAEFKAGKRQNAIMQGFASLLSEDDMKHVAAFYASKQAKPGFAKNKDTVRLGEAIFRGGIKAKQVPSCAGCHSPNGAGIPAQYPRLAGQHAEYTESQLVAFRSGARANNAQMMTISARLSDVEIKAVSDYLAGLR
jgi:cytochrome c553